jgi:hypothetical protein
MLINKQQVKRYYHSHKKKIGKKQLELIDAKLRLILDKSIRASGPYSTIKENDFI